MSTAELFTTVGGLSGPADADNFRMTVDWGRWYIDPLPTCAIAEATEDKWPSISAVKKAADKDWSFLVVPRMAAIDGDELHRIARLDRTQRADALNSHEKLAKQIAFGRGSIVHLWKEDLLAGRAPREITDAWLTANKYPTASRDDALRFLPAIVDFFDTYQPEPVAVEYVTIHRTLNGHGYGGTPDALLKIEGEIVAADWKTRSDGSNHGAFAEELAQVSAGAGAEYMIMRDGDHAVRRPIPKAQGGVIVSIKTDGARLYPLDLDKGWTHWCHLHEWWVHRLDEKAGIGRVKPKRSGPATKNSVEGQPAVGVASPDQVAVGATDAATDNSVAGTAFRARPGPQSTPPSVDAAATDLRRADLRRRFNLLNDHDQAKFRGLMIDPNDLDLIETHLNALDVFMTNDTVTPAPKPGIDWKPVPPQRPKVVPIPEPSLGEAVEGPTVTDGEWSNTARAFDQLDAAGKTFVKDIVAEAHAAQQWMSGIGNKTTRRLHLLRGLVRLAEAGEDEDEVTRRLVETVVDSDVPMMFTLGQVVGALTATEAVKFDELVDAFVAGELEASVREDGTMRLIAAQAKAEKHK